jgi:phosphate transport system substrate-binding protein
MEFDSVNTFTKRRRVTAALLVGTFLLAACGDDDDDGAGDTSGGATTAASETTGAAPSTGGSETTAGGATTGGSATTGGGGGNVSGSIAVSGSSTVEPISSAIGGAFSDANPGVAISVDGPGTGDGLAMFCNGEIDIADASRAIEEEEATACADNGIEFVELKIALDGLSVITSAEDTEIECLSFVDLWALLGPDSTGINNWSDASSIADEVAQTVTDLGAVHTPYPDADLAITAPGEESGTFDSFNELVIAPVGEELGVEDAVVRPDYTASPNDNVIVEGIGQNPTSLGWVGFAFVEENLDTIKPIQVDGGGGCVEPTPETIAGGDYPIARELYIYVSTAAAQDNPAVAPFVDYYLSDEGIGAVLGTEQGQVPYVPLAPEDLEASRTAWADMTTGSQAGG